MADEDFLMFSSCLAEGMDFLEHKLPCEFPYMDLVPSPVESAVSSTESDEDEYILALTKLMAGSSLENEGEDVPQKFGEFASSPQSTLCLARCCSQASSTLPLMTNNPKNERPDPPYAVSGHLAGMKVGDQDSMYLRELLGVPVKSASDGLSRSGMSMRAADVSAHHSLRRCWSDNNRNSAAMSLQIEMLKQQQRQHSLWRCAKISEVQQICGCARSTTNVKTCRSLGLPSSGTPFQINTPNAGMRAYFHGNSGSRRESSGTGVFLPRRAGNLSDLRKKSACSTVLLPARVVQALNLNVDDLRATQPSYYLGRLNHGRDPSIDVAPPPFVARNGFLPPQQRFVRPQSTAVRNELHLPQEWTY